MTPNQPIDFYTPAHNVLRHHLLTLALHTANTDFTDPVAVQGLRQDLRSLVAELRWHAEVEEKFFQPLLGRILPAVHVQLEEEHRLVDGQLEVLEDHLARVATSNRSGASQHFYRAVLRFMSDYFMHMETEEDAMPRIRERISQVELADALRAAGSQPPPPPPLPDLRTVPLALQVPVGGTLE